MNIVEIIGAATGVVGIWLTVKKHIACWPFLIVSIFCYIGVFWSERLYADMALQWMFLALGIFGWMQWSKRTDGESTFVVQTLSARQLLATAFFTAIAGIGLGWLLSTATDADYAYSDSMLSAASVAAQYFAAKKYIEHWKIWIVVDVLYAGLYLQKSLFPTAIFYCVLAVLAWRGLQEWKTTLKGQTSQS